MIIVLGILVIAMIGAAIWHNVSVANVWIRYLETTIIILEKINDPNYIANKALDSVFKLYSKSLRNKKLKTALDDYLTRAKARITFLKTTPPTQYDD